MKQRWKKRSVSLLSFSFMITTSFRSVSYAGMSPCVLTATDSNAEVRSYVSTETDSNVGVRSCVSTATNSNAETSFDIVTATDSDAVPAKQALGNRMKTVVYEENDCNFDFIMDPYHFLEKTDAVRYGGGTVEEDATLLFYNQDGEYDFCSESDKLTLILEKDAEITISAAIRDLGTIKLIEDKDFSNLYLPAMYMAIVDDLGNEMPLSADETMTFTLALDAGEYSFGLTGACNSNASWNDIEVSPVLEITWKAEVLSDETEVLFYESETVKLESTEESGQKFIEETKSEQAENSGTEKSEEADDSDIGENVSATEESFEAEEAALDIENENSGVDVNVSDVERTASNAEMDVLDDETDSTGVSSE